MLRLVIFAAAAILQAASVLACPFCSTPRPSLEQRIERADVAFLGDVTNIDDHSCTLRVRHAIKVGDQVDAEGLITIKSPAEEGDERPRQGSLLLALAVAESKSSTKRAWTTVALNEASFAYVVRLPASQNLAVGRLRYAMHYLEHADPLIADDAYLEFGHAPFDEIAKLAGELPVDRLRGWLTDNATPPERKGLYGLLLGLAASAQQRNDVADDFWRWIVSPANDFRSGFDGVLGGYLWLAKSEALARLEKRYFDDRQAAVGDLRHLLTALRVYHDNGHDIPREELMRVYRRFLDRPAVAALAISDLSRWQDWQSLGRVSAIFGQPGYDDRVTERAIIGYLLACPLPVAARHVARLRKLVPDLVAEAERVEGSNSGER